MDPRERFARLEARWQRLVERYLPGTDAGSPWRVNPPPAEGTFPRQGWKLHLSATVLSAPRLLHRAGPVLARHGAIFKAPRNLVALAALNAGDGGFSQVGKCITVYCRDEREAQALARELDAATVGIPHPRVPFDRHYRPDSCVYYRYGAFAPGGHVDAFGVARGEMVDGDGVVVADRCGPAAAVPAWVTDPLEQTIADKAPEHHPTSPLATHYRAFQALRKRGKGGVFLALDMTSTPPRLCVIKEGLRHGEVTPDGRDGRWRVKNEARVLRALTKRGVPVPEVIAEFDVDGGHYLVLEHIEGSSLDQHLAELGDDVPRRVDLARELAGLMDAIHAAGWAWRDCKPQNIIVSDTGRLRPIDFEGASRLATGRAIPWGTVPYRAPLPRLGEAYEPLAEDDYALRVTVEEITTGGRLTGKTVTRIL